ncbi:MBL fold metallo-hydrolase [Deinococcus ficus]|uniref:MBL fold metallo-hydrolase n=1 Tax=Deinococcus ficus TaxID=317577 RepID=UPI00174B5B3C|nr:MBL fold metallo-hydrolase [Deinococcus ficus]GHF71380.1 MBL fold hydrolase [Deinococcus ficus]
MSSATPTPGRSSPPRLSRLVTGGGHRVYTLNVQAFVGLRVNLFVLLTGPAERPDYCALIDCGSPQPVSIASLNALHLLRAQYGEQCGWETLDRTVVTHAHPDHAGGLPHVRSLSRAPVAAHEWGVPILEDPHAFREEARGPLRAYAAWLGVPEGSEYAARLENRANNLMLPSGVPVRTTLRHGDLLDGLLQVWHTPGHAGSQVCLQFDDVLLSADHLLPRNSPPLLPAWLHRGGGLHAYLESLNVIEGLSGVRVALGGHDEPMPAWRARIAELRARYETKLENVLAAAEGPSSVYDLTHRVARVNPRQALLLLDQTAALCEELVRRGALREMPGTGGEALFVRV